MSRVVVLGASGEMGARVVRLLREQLPGVQVVEASRRGGTPLLPMRSADVADTAGLRALLDDADLVVNAVGPYAYDPAPLVAAAIDAHCHYVDLAEAAEFVERVRSLARARGAEEAGVAVISGGSTVPGMVQLLVGRWGEREDVAQVGAWLSMGSRNPVSRGLLLGMLGPLGRPAPDGRRWFTKVKELPPRDGRRLHFGTYPAAFPEGVALGRRRVPLHFHMGFDRTWITGLLASAAHLIGRLPRRALSALGPLLLLGARAARPLGTWRGVLILTAESAEGVELDRVELHADAEGLDVPASPPVWVARRLLQEPSPGNDPEQGASRGALELDQVVPRDIAERWLEEAGFRLE